MAPPMFCPGAAAPAAEEGKALLGLLRRHIDCKADCVLDSADPLCPLPVCHQLDSALHILSGCQSYIVSSMKTEHHNVAGRIIIKALSKSPWGA
eukprot:544742-Pelagomonas_calceolata.AAC.1